MRLASMLTLSAISFAVAFGTTGCSFKAGIGDKEAKVAEPPAPPEAVDADSDGIQDQDDKCPDEAEDGKPPEPNDGCLTTDTDGDGIANADDSCPEEAGKGADGCAAEGSDEVELTDTEVKIKHKIHFAKGKAEIEGDDSFKVLDAVAALLNDHAELELMEIAGHASKEGPAYLNNKLTQQRTESVVKYLVEKGVAKERLQPHGYGFYCPKSEGNHQANRRVEFKILHRSGKIVTESVGCEAAEKAGLKHKVPPIKG